MIQLGITKNLTRPIRTVKLQSVCVYLCVCERRIQVMVQLQGGMTSPLQSPRGQMSSVAGWCGSDRPLGLFISGKFNPNTL